MREAWKISPTLPDYMVSNRGLVMRRPTIGKMPNGGERQYGGTPHRGSWDGSRHIITHKGKTYRVHRLVCEAFNGPPPFEGAVAMHVNENSRNNNAPKLAWRTKRENLNAPGFLK